MGWLSSKGDHNENQIKIYQELLDKAKEQYDALKSGSSSPEIQANREQLFEKIKQLELQMEEARERLDNNKERGAFDGMDLFED